MQGRPFWDRFSTWQEAETAWDEKKKKCLLDHPIKQLKALPSTVGIVDETRRYLRLKGLVWLLRKDSNFALIRSLLRHPFRHFNRYVRSLLSPSFYIRQNEDLYFFGVRSLSQFHELLNNPETVFLLGFSYCQKPFECPSKRFSSSCQASSDHPVCAQCFIGKCMNALPKEKTISIVVPTVNDMGLKIFEIKRQFPNKKIVFLISTCEMMLEMLGDYSNMVDIQGVGVRLGGRFCNTFTAFRLAEEGKKPGLTCVLPHSERRILDAIQHWREIVRGG